MLYVLYKSARLLQSPCWLQVAGHSQPGRRGWHTVVCHPGTSHPDTSKLFSPSHSVTLRWVRPFHRNLLVFSFSTCKWGRRLLGHFWEGLGELCEKGAVRDQMPVAASGIKLVGEGLALTLQHLLGTSSQVNWHSTCDLVPLCLRASPAQWGWWCSSGYMSVER